MFSEENIQKLKIILKEFYTITKITIAVFDENFNFVAKYPRYETPMLCRLIQGSPLSAGLCASCDKNAMRYAAKRKMPYVYHCHAGLTECVMPITADLDNPVGYIMLGHMYTANVNGSEEDNIISRCERYGIKKGEIMKALSMLNVLDSEYITSAAHISQYLASYILSENIYTLNLYDMPLRIAHYIQENYKEKITVQDISQKFNIGKTTMYKLFKEKYKMGVAAYLRKTRLNHARDLLLNTQSISISEVCEKCGFDDYNYFIVCFKKEFDISPKAYAARNQGRGEI